MKKIIFLIASLVSIINVFSQQDYDMGEKNIEFTSKKRIDTIFLKEDKIVSIIAPSECEIVNYKFGNEEGIEIDKYFNSITLKKEKNNSDYLSTNVLVCYKDQDNNLFYQYYDVVYVLKKDRYSENVFTIIKPEKRKNLTEEEKKLKTKQIEMALVQERLRKLSFISNEINDCGVLGDITVYLRNIYSDDKYLYLRIEIENKNTIDYSFEYLKLTYFLPFRKGWFSPVEYDKIDCSIILYDDDDNKKSNFVKGKTKAYLCFSVPLAGLKNKDYLNVVLDENKGTRNIEFNISSDIIKNAKSINKIGK